MFGSQNKKSRHISVQFPTGRPSKENTLFRLFLLKKMFSAFGKKPENEQKPSNGRKRNRRIYERYSIDHKHLTLLNEQDIFLVRDISAQGFSTYSSPRGLSRLDIGDVFASRMRYLGETYDMSARVSWKGRDVVGFEQVDPTPDVLNFMQRLLHPIEIASSLQAMDDQIVANHNDDRLWLHGDEETDLYIWKASSGQLEAWQLIMGDHFVDWDPICGLRTGQMQVDSMASPLITSDTRHQVYDPGLDLRKKQFATDILMAADIKDKDEILATITRA